VADGPILLMLEDKPQEAEGGNDQEGMYIDIIYIILLFYK
jgi:hypothetical protein